ncbi:MAG TPA: acyl-CoA dehydrogenase [Phycisphaerae bacterium]
MSANEPLKREAIAKLEAGGLFAFGVSEQAHGSDLLANEFTARAAGPERWIADGKKYYIGNANAAGIISILARKGDAESSGARRMPFVFFAMRPQETPAFQNLQKIRTLGVRTAFVGEFEVKQHAFSQADVISEGREAWDAILGTVNFGKFFLGFGAVGICEHAFAEAIVYLRQRVLYGKPVTEMPHIRAATALAFARLLAMKLYAYRALDYLQAASDDDRRYLLFNAVQKARVSTEGVKVLALLSECLGARGFETETYFESALRDAQLIPGLEGSTHINFGLTAQFIEPYFAERADDVAAPGSLVLREAKPDENPYWLHARDRNARTVRFAHCLQACEGLSSDVNMQAFTQQVQAFRQFAEHHVPALHPSADAGLLITAGKCFAVIAYAQLVAESCSAVQTASAVVTLIFHGFIEDLSAEALKLAAMYPADSIARIQLQSVVQVPQTGPADFAAMLEIIATRYLPGYGNGA